MTREYYFNDSGAQIRNLGASVAALRRGEPVPEDGYTADYVSDLATALPDDVWAAATAPDADTDGLVGGWAAGRVVFCHDPVPAHPLREPVGRRAERR